MAENRIKSVRQFCVSVMMLCLAFFGVFVVQEETGWQAASAETLAGERDKLSQSGQLLQMGEDAAVGGGHGDTEIVSSGWSQLFGTNPPEIIKRQGDTCVVIRKNGTVLDGISEEMVYRKVTAKFTGLVTEAEIYRVSGENLYVGVPDVPVVEIPEEEKNVPLVREPKAPGEDLLLSVAVSEEDGVTEVALEFNSVYEVTVTEDEEFIYLSLIRPHEKYEKILVIDAGHGGIDIGTSGGGHWESTINLAVVQYLKELLDARPEWKVYYTRLNDTLPDLSTRVEFANALHADMLISIHCNHNPVSVVNGVEALYSKVQGAEDVFNSKVLAQLCSAYVTEATGLKERPLVERSKNLHIIKYCTMPMTIIEYGYMSNRNDLAKITTGKSQRECAAGVYRAIEEAYKILETGSVELVNE